MSDEQMADGDALPVPGDGPIHEPVPPPPAAGSVPVLQKLSTTPFPRSNFPMLGIMASVYEHVTSVASRMRDRCRPPAR